VKVGGLVPLRDDISAGLLALLDDDARVRGIVGIDVEDQLAAGALQQRPDVSDTLLGIAFRHKRLIFGVDRFGEILAALGECGVIGVGERAHRIGERPRRLLSESGLRERKP